MSLISSCVGMAWTPLGCLNGIHGRRKGTRDAASRSTQAIQKKEERDTMSQLSRRDFLKGGAAALGGGLFAATAATGCAPESQSLGETGNGAQGGNDDAAAAVGNIAVHDTDVVVIGGGVAGVQTALVAAEGGAHVIVLDKKRFAHSGDSGLHYAGNMNSSEFEIEGDNPQVHLEDAVENTRYIVDQPASQDILQGYYDDGVLMESENSGNLHWRDKDTGQPMISPSTNRPRRWPGYKVVNPARKARALGVEVKEYCSATKILTDSNGSACGVCALDFKTGQFFIVRAKSVVLATGGVNGLMGAGDIAASYGGCAYNLVGDGHALAAPLGVRFKDLEFRSNTAGSFLVCGISSMGVTSFPWLGTQGWDNWRDADGNLVFPEGSEAPTIREQLIAFYRLKNESKLGPNGGVFVGMTPVSEHAVLGLTPYAQAQCQLSWEAQNAMPEQVEIVPVSVYDYGGIVTDTQGATDVDGLYAVGECAMHTGAGYWAFRMFSSAMVLGRRIGNTAAERARSVEFSNLDLDVITAERDRVEAFLTNEPSEPITVFELRHKIQNAAWLGAGALRSDATCAAALDMLAECEQQLPNVIVDAKSRVCNMGWSEALELPNMIKVARMVTMACQARTESRGSHFRADYPMEDNDNWIKNIYVTEVDGKPQISIEDTVLGLVEVPGGTNDMGGGTLELNWQSWA